MQFEHTPGPWEISWHVAVDGKGRAKYRLPTHIGPIVVGDSKKDLSAADAHLIAAAPELLEALRMSEKALAAELEMRNAAEDVTDAGYEVPIAPALRAVRMAIAKAEGRA